MNKQNGFLVFLILHFILIILRSSIANAIEVSGHLTEDTTWSPDNNPYLVTETLFVDSGITLTILPGTEIKVFGAQLSNYNDYTQNFWLYNGDSIAKFIQIDGGIIAEGTQQDSIVFTRLQDDPNYNWGTIYITEDAEFSKFQFCKIEHVANIGLALSYISQGLSFFNGNGSVRNCSFYNYTIGVSSSSYSKNLEIVNNLFQIDNGVNPFFSDFNYGKHHIISYRNSTICPDLLVCGNVFKGFNSYTTIVANQLSFSFNNIESCTQADAIGYYYNNNFTNCLYGIRTGYEGDSLYIKQNNFIAAGVDIDYAYVEISDNYFDGCKLDTGLASSGAVYNNFIYNGSLYSTSYLIVCNNITYNGTTGIIITYRNEINSNNISIYNQYAFGGYFNDYYNNCIILANEELTQYGVSGNPVFRNCIIDFPLDPPLIDGGGNIIVDSLQVQSIFVDIQNGDFHLAAGSIAIDAGFDTIGYYYPFDMEYNQRVWDGDNNGSAIIDIGPYEYGAPALGGIQGITYDPTSGLPVDYVLIKINNEPGEFTFSDSIGNYEYKLPAGVYDIYAERVFYDDAVEYQIEVFDGEFTEWDIPMYETVEITQHLIPKTQNLLKNYPNPFNPTTNISFNLSFESDVSLSIYNVKGQLVKQLVNEQLSAGPHTIEWNGKDSNNKSVSSGIYYYKVSSGKDTAINKMLLLK
jgi:hypothetical protein